VVRGVNASFNREDYGFHGLQVVSF